MKSKVINILVIVASVIFKHETVTFKKSCDLVDSMSFA